MFGWLDRAWQWATGRVDRTVRGWAHDIVSALYAYVHMVFGDIIKGWRYFYSTMHNTWVFVGHFLDSVTREILYLWRVWVPNLFIWLGQHVIVPIANAFNWIDHQGITLWFYLTHPDQLASYLYLHLVREFERLAWETARELGTFFLALIVHNLRRVLVLVEDIVDAVL